MLFAVHSCYSCKRYSETEPSAIPFGEPQGIEKMLIPDDDASLQIQEPCALSALLTVFNQTAMMGKGGS